MYKIKIEKLIPNLNYEAELEEYKQRRKEERGPFNVHQFDNTQREVFPKKFIVDRTLEAELTDEEYDAVKKAIITKI